MQMFYLCFFACCDSAYKTGMNRRTDLYLKENEHIRKYVYCFGAEGCLCFGS